MSHWSTIIQLGLPGGLHIIFHPSCLTSYSLSNPYLSPTVIPFFRPFLLLPSPNECISVACSFPLVSPPDVSCLSHTGCLTFIITAGSPPPLFPCWSHPARSSPQPFILILIRRFMPVAVGVFSCGLRVEELRRCVAVGKDVGLYTFLCCLF